MALSSWNVWRWARQLMLSATVSHYINCKKTWYSLSCTCSSSCDRCVQKIIEKFRCDSLVDPPTTLIFHLVITMYLVRSRNSNFKIIMRSKLALKTSSTANSRDSSPRLSLFFWVLGHMFHLCLPYMFRIYYFILYTNL